MRRTASEVIRELEMRVARLEKQATSSLSNEAKSMMLALANHSRRTPMPKKGNFNILQEVLEALGFNFEMKEAQDANDNLKHKTAFEDFEKLGQSIYFILVSVDEYPTFEEAFQKYEEEIERIKKAIPYVDFVDRKPSKPTFGRISIILTSMFYEKRKEWWKFYLEDAFVGIKKVTTSKNGKKVAIKISPYKLDLENFDLTKITKFAVKEGAVEDAKDFLRLAPQTEPEQTLEEQNKGTCPMCWGVYAKRRDGKLFKHGYRIQHGWRETISCYGSFEHPIETSPEGLKNVKRKVNEEIEELERRQPSDPIHQRKKERSISVFKDLITKLNQQIRSWRPQG